MHTTPFTLEGDKFVFLHFFLFLCITSVITDALMKLGREKASDHTSHPTTSLTLC